MTQTDLVCLCERMPSISPKHRLIRADASISIVIDELYLTLPT